MKVWSTQLNMELMPLFAKAAALKQQPDHTAVSDLCRQLTGITKIRYAEVTADLALLEMPRGYMHVRLFNEADQQEFTSSFSTTGKPVTPSTIATLIMINPRFLADEWIATKAFPDNPYEARGVLDLLVRFKPRVKRLDFFDVD